MMLPAGIRPSLEMIESQFGFEFLILLFDRPALVREGDQRTQRRVRRQMHEEVLDALGASRFFLAQPPDVGRQLALPPRMGRGDADGREPRAATRLPPVAPRYGSPRRRRAAAGGGAG